MIEKIVECAKYKVDKGIEQLDTKEMGAVTDIIKDLCEAEYYAKISKAMDESEYGEDYNVDGPIRKFYRGQPRDRMGRFKKTRRGKRMGYMPDMMPMPDEMDLEEYMEMYGMMPTERVMGRMYYPDENDGYTGQVGGNRGDRTSSNYRPSSRYGYSHDEYMDKMSKHEHGTPEDKQKRKELMEERLMDISDMLTDTMEKMSPEEKQMWKQKLNKLINM